VTGNGIARACEASLARLGTNYLDLYLLHWPQGITLHSARWQQRARPHDCTYRRSARLLGSRCRAGLDHPRR
jgi:aryl-alcohol dehydrogenase-like predicted oxidoreductase